MSDRPECAMPQRDVLEETVTVAEVSDGWVWLEGVRRSACSGCSVPSACGSGALATLFMDRRVRLAMRNDFDARPGEQVVIGLDPLSIRRGSLLAYLMPAAAMVGAAMLASAAGLGETAAVLASFIVLGAALCATHGLARRRWCQTAPVYLRRAGPPAPRHGGQQALSSGIKGQTA